jgi:hypothetical protein
MTVVTRKVEVPQYDGSTGAELEPHVNYELGDEIDGVFVPFVTVRESFVNHTVRLGKEAAEKAKTKTDDTTEAA